MCIKNFPSIPELSNITVLYKWEVYYVYKVIDSLHPFWCLEYNDQGRRKHGRTRGHQLARALLDKKRAQKNIQGNHYSMPVNGLSKPVAWEDPGRGLATCCQIFSYSHLVQ